MAAGPEQPALRSFPLLLGGPQVRRAARPFVRLREAAMAMAAGMDGLVTDDQGAVVGVDAMDVIGADLERLYDTLDSYDLAAGSPQARRLFS